MLSWAIAAHFKLIATDAFLIFKLACKALQRDALIANFQRF
jgi:hypothetical protein